jgi:hypothetical protein
LTLPVAFPEKNLLEPFDDRNRKQKKNKKGPDEKHERKKNEIIKRKEAADTQAGGEKLLSPLPLLFLLFKDKKSLSVFFVSLCICLIFAFGLLVLSCFLPILVVGRVQKGFGDFGFFSLLSFVALLFHACIRLFVFFSSFSSSSSSSSSSSASIFLLGERGEGGF